WTLNAPMVIGAFMTTLQGSGINALKDAGGNGLSAGSGFAENFKVLTGDVNDDGVVSSADVVAVNNARTLPYNILYDLNGDGVIDINDINIARNRIGSTLP